MLHDQPDLTFAFTVDEPDVRSQQDAAVVEGFTESGAPFIAHLNQLAQAEAALAKATNDQNINWPTIGMSPINEFTHEGYMVQAFPTLYP